MIALSILVLAAVVFYVGRKIARVLFSIGVVVEEIGKRSVDDWPSDDDWKRAFHE
jgi:hypothetical protein